MEKQPSGFTNRVYSELDPSRYETRKVEVFAGGKMSYASKQLEVPPTRLGITPVPTIAEIMTQPEFTVKEISKQEFESIWTKATK